jgi:hypothetical protein
MAVDIPHTIDAERLREIVLRVMKRARIARVCVKAVINGARIELDLASERSADHCAEPTEQRVALGCMKRVILGIVALKLAASGRLDLDAPVAAALPELERSTGVRQTLVRHLLSHTSGYQPIARSRDSLDHHQHFALCVEHLKNCSTLFRAGTVFNYCETDYVLLAEILHRLTGTRQLSQLLELHPLPLPAQEKPFPWSREWWTVDELLELGSSLLLLQITDDSSMKGLWGVEVTLPRALPQQWQQHLPAAFGLGLALYADGSAGHPGSAADTCCAIRFDARQQLALAIGMTGHAPHVRDGLIDVILRLSGMDIAASGISSGPVQKFRATELAGTYGNSAGMLQIFVYESRDAVVLRISNPITGTSSERVFETIGMQQREGAAAVPVFFFRDPVDGTPCLMHGWHAYRRCA